MSDPTATPTSPRRFRFGLRSLFVLVVIAALPCAWVGYQMNWIRQRREAIANGRATVALSKIAGSPGMVAAAPRAPGALWFFGEAGVERLIVDEGNAAWAARLFPEAKVVELVEAPLVHP